MELIMQTVCAHCYAFLPRRRQRTACILCTKCEQNWVAGKAPVQGNKLPDWPGNFGLLSKSAAQNSQA
jgi:hypothetical protein